MCISVVVIVIIVIFNQQSHYLSYLSWVLLFFFLLHVISCHNSFLSIRFSFLFVICISFHFADRMCMYKYIVHGPISCPPKRPCTVTAHRISLLANNIAKSYTEYCIHTRLLIACAQKNRYNWNSKCILCSVHPHSHIQLYWSSKRHNTNDRVVSSLANSSRTAYLKCICKFSDLVFHSK